MSLINCPECGKQVSNNAVACPNCGHPLAPPAIESQTVIRETVPPVVEKESFPMWILAPILILGAVLIFLLFFLFRTENDDNQRNINVGVRTNRPADRSDRSSSTETETSRVTVPPAAETNIVIPQDVPPTTRSDVSVSENPDSATSDSASVTLEAKISNRAGNITPVRAEKFYLLDESLESILRDAEIKDESGGGVINAFGLSVLYPERYSETNKNALNEINKHIVHDTLTDSTGKAQMKNVKPGSYYLFGITKTKNGFAVWSSPVSINPGQNVLNLSPARLTEIEQ